MKAYIKGVVVEMFAVGEVGWAAKFFICCLSKEIAGYYGARFNLMGLAIFH